MAAQMGEKHHRAQRSDTEVRQAVNMVRILHTSRRAVAKQFNVDERTVRRWLAGARRPARGTR